MRVLVQSGSAEILELDGDVVVAGRTLRSGDWGFRRERVWFPSAVLADASTSERRYERWDSRALSIPLRLPPTPVGRATKDMLLVGSPIEPPEGRPVRGEELFRSFLSFDLSLNLLEAHLLRATNVGGLPIGGSVRFHPDGSFREGVLAESHALGGILVPSGTYLHFESAGMRRRICELPREGASIRVGTWTVPPGASIVFDDALRFDHFTVETEDDTYVEVLGATVPPGTVVTVDAKQQVHVAVDEPATLGGVELEPGRRYLVREGRPVPDTGA